MKGMITHLFIPQLLFCKPKGLQWLCYFCSADYVALQIAFERKAGLKFPQAKWFRFILFIFSKSNRSV